MIFTSQDHDLAEGGLAHEGPTASFRGLAGIPETAETVALARNLLLVEQSGVRAHFSQLTSARGVELIAQAQARGLPVTADVALYQLILTDEALADFSSLYHVQPPLRSQKDREALREAVKSGVIQAIASHHQPHEADAKNAPFAATDPGISSVELLLPLAMTLVQDGLLDLPTCSHACRPARLPPCACRPASWRSARPPTWCCSKPTARPWRARPGTPVARTARSSATACRAWCAAPWWTGISSTRSDASPHHEKPPIGGLFHDATVRHEQRSSSLSFRERVGERVGERVELPYSSIADLGPLPSPPPEGRGDSSARIGIHRQPDISERIRSLPAPWRGQYAGLPRLPHPPIAGSANHRSPAPRGSPAGCWRGS